MNIAMNTVTIKQVPFSERLKLISEGGFLGVGLWMGEVEDYLKGRKAKPIKELLEEYRLKPVEMQDSSPSTSTEERPRPLHEWQYLTGPKRKRAFEEAKDFFRRFSKLGIDCPVVAVGTYDKVGDLRDSVKDFRDLCRLASDFGARVMFEFVGWAKQFNNVKVAWEVVGEANCPNGGMLFDIFHFVKTGSTIEDLKGVDVKKVFLVHISDAKPLQLGFKEQSRRFRFLPGEGEAPLKEIIGFFTEKGYKGFYCLEIFNEKYWAEDPAKVVRKSKESLETLFASLTSLTNP
jgi:sugar phosphate isomerase/epimerase